MKKSTLQLEIFSLAVMIAAVLLGGIITLIAAAFLSGINFVYALFLAVVCAGGVIVLAAEASSLMKELDDEDV